MNTVFIYKNDNRKSAQLAKKVEALLTENGISYTESFEKGVDFVIAIGGDGTFLHATRAVGFKSIPILGINTGHLGFFSELFPEDLDKLDGILSGDYVVQPHKALKIETQMKEAVITEYALNDISILHYQNAMMPMKVSIGRDFIEDFRGDGLIIASSAGSTARNYSLGGAIVDPKLDLLQLTPIAPVNNSVYRCFSTSLLLPTHQKVAIIPEDKNSPRIIVDGETTDRKDVEKITISLSNKKVQIVRLPEYDFWGKVKEKFL